MNPILFTSISFPFLGVEVNPARVLKLGPLSIHYYGIVIVVGLLLAVWYASKHCYRVGITEDNLMDGVLWITPLAIACARIYYCAFTWEEYSADPISVLYIWNGGIAIYGSVIGAVIGVVIFCRMHKCSLPALLDLVLTSFLIGQFIGRWGNFFNREAFGAATDSYFRMGLYNILADRWSYVHPTFLYESVWNLAGFLLLHFLTPKRQYDGQIALGYCAWYGLGRSWIEGLRVDSLYWGSFRVSQVLAILTCVTAVTILTVQAFRPHDHSRLAENQGK